VDFVLALEPQHSPLTFITLYPSTFTSFFSDLAIDIHLTQPLDTDASTPPSNNDASRQSPTLVMLDLDAGLLVVE